MNGTEQSDSPIVPKKLANKAAHAAAEPMEGSGGTERNAELQSTVRTQSRAAVSQAQGRIREAVTRNKKERLTALLHHIGTDCLRWAFVNLKKRAAPGVDEVTWDQYAENLEANLADLHARVHAGTYRALPSRRKYIPKADGSQRPLGIAAIEDKIVQAAVVAILTPIYEAEFLGCESAWNKDPVFGVIGIQSGPPGRWVHSGFRNGYGGQVGDAGSGDSREDPSGVFRPEQANQDDLPRVSGVATGRAQGDPVTGDRVSL